MTLAQFQGSSMTEIDQIEASFIANIERGEQALAEAENDYQRLEVRDAARAAQVVTAVMGRRRLVRRFSVLVQRAERAIAQANPPMTRQDVGEIGNAIKHGRDSESLSLLEGERERRQAEGIDDKFLEQARAAHNSLTDEEFEALANEDTDEPMSRQRLKDIAKEKRDLALESDEGDGGKEVAYNSEESKSGFNPDLVEEMIDQVGDQVRDLVAQLPDKSDRVLEIVQESIQGLGKRLEAYPQNSARMEAKFEHLREMQERGVIPYTVWDFPFRDDYAGDKNYHGNCSPQIVEQCIWRLTEEGDLVIDPMAGSGTAIDVCAKFNRRYAAYDLFPTRNDIQQADARHLPVESESADMVFIHPPYWDMVRYSKGRDVDADLSRAKSVEQFLDMLATVFAECKRVLKPDKYLCLLLGDLVNGGQFYPLSRKAANILEGMGMEDAGYAVKLAHGDTSRRKSGVIVAELVATNNLKVSHDSVIFFRKNWE